MQPCVCAKTVCVYVHVCVCACVCVCARVCARVCGWVRVDGCDLERLSSTAVVAVSTGS